MKIPYNKDTVNDEAPSADRGTGPFDNPGIQPYESAVPETAGEKLLNPTTPDEYTKNPPYKPEKYSGYSK